MNCGLEIASSQTLSNLKNLPNKTHQKDKQLRQKLKINDVFIAPEFLSWLRLIKDRKFQQPQEFLHCQFYMLQQLLNQLWLRNKYCVDLTRARICVVSETDVTKTRLYRGKLKGVDGCGQS